MTWQKEVDEIKKRHHLAEKMGGEEGIARQHKRGKLTIRERIAALVDPGSFQQWGKLAGSAMYDENNEMVNFMPSASVSGLCSINGRKVFLTGQDFTVRGGSGAASGAGIDAGHNHPSPIELRLPTINLVDGAGGSVTGFSKLGRTYIPDGAFFGPLSEMLTVAPVACSTGRAKAYTGAMPGRPDTGVRCTSRGEPQRPSVGSSKPLPIPKRSGWSSNGNSRH